jgi:uncharacterized HhH-GPD family protein
MVLDQQIPLERAFSAPRDLRDRLGGVLDAGMIATMDPGELATVFAQRPALHRFPTANAQRVQQLCQVIVGDYAGQASLVWQGAPNGAELLN